MTTSNEVREDIMAAYNITECLPCIKITTSKQKNPHKHGNYTCAYCKTRFLKIKDVEDHFKICVDVKEKYNELLMAVARKFPNETRHETALRYIREAEKLSDNITSSNVDIKE